MLVYLLVLVRLFAWYANKHTNPDIRHKPSSKETKNAFVRLFVCFYLLVVVFVDGESLILEYGTSWMIRLFVWFMSLLWLSVWFATQHTNTDRRHKPSSKGSCLFCVYVFV